MNEPRLVTEIANELVNNLGFHREEAVTEAYRILAEFAVDDSFSHAGPAPTVEDLLADDSLQVESGWLIERLDSGDWIHGYGMIPGSDAVALVELRRAVEAHRS